MQHAVSPTRSAFKHSCPEFTSRRDSPVTPSMLQMLASLTELLPSTAGRSDAVNEAVDGTATLSGYETEVGSVYSELPVPLTWSSGDQPDVDVNLDKPPRRWKSSANLQERPPTPAPPRKVGRASRRQRARSTSTSRHLPIQDPPSDTEDELNRFNDDLGAKSSACISTNSVEGQDSSAVADRSPVVPLGDNPVASTEEPAQDLSVVLVGNVIEIKLCTGFRTRLNITQIKPDVSFVAPK